MTLPDQDNGVRALKLRGQVTFGTDSDVSKAPNSDDIGDGIAVDGDRIEFRPNGRATLNSSGTLPTIYMRNDQGQQGDTGEHARDGHGIYLGRVGLGKVMVGRRRCQSLSGLPWLLGCFMQEELNS